MTNLDSQLDKIDQRLLDLLTDNARASVTTLAHSLGLARTTVQARIDRLETRGIIAGYTLKPGAKLGRAVRATALLSVEPRSTPGVLSRLKALPQVRQVHTVSGRFDLIVEIAAETTEELDTTLDQIGEARGVKSSESLVHLSTKLDRR